MEYRDEIIDELSSKEIFFQNHLVEYEKPQIYSLEEEFANAKKNRDLKPYLIFFGFIFLLIVATVVTANYLEVKSKQVNIDISDFEDLQLKETLNSAKETEKELNRVSAILYIKTKELNNKTQENNLLRSTFDARVQRIKADLQHEADLKNADKKALKRLEDLSKKQLADAKKDYDKKFAVKQAEVAQLQQQAKDSVSYQYGLTTYLKELKAAGCVTDPRQRKNILLYFYKNPKFSGETTVELYRGKDQYIGKLKLTPGDTGVGAEFVEAARGQNIKPLDWFRL